MGKILEKRIHGYIYCHIFPNKKRYIGQTSNSLSKRFGKNGSGYSRNPLIWKAILKYGWENVIHVILEEGDWTKDEINKKEQFYISKFNTLCPNGYNLTPGGEIASWGVKPVIQIDRISLKPIQKFGTLYEAAIAVKGSPECICQCCKRKIRTANNYCWCYEEEFNEQWKPVENKFTKRPRIYCLENNTIYNSPIEAANELKVYATKIREVCKGKLISTHGYHFCYEQNKDNYTIRHKKCFTPVICITTQQEFQSIAEASRKTGCSYVNIKRCLSGRQKKTKGLQWKYKEGPKRKWNNKN